MSTIKVLFRMSDQQFVFVPDDLSPFYCDILAGIVKEQERQGMDEVSFGYSIAQENAELSSGSWPPPGVRYVETDQEIIESARVSWSPTTPTVLEVWLEFSGLRFEGGYLFTTPDAPEWVDPEGEE